jgi:carbon monoxide dehydrogenase subunit G
MKLTFLTSKSLDQTFDYLTDMQKFAAIHPVISKIIDKGEQHYLVYETLSFAGIPFSFTYPVFVSSDHKNNTVTFKATVFKFTKIEMYFLLRTENNNTIIEEEILIKTVLPIKFLMQHIFKTQHSQLFKNLEAI